MRMHVPFQLSHVQDLQSCGEIMVPKPASNWSVLTRCRLGILQVRAKCLNLQYMKRMGTGGVQCTYVESDLAG